jgi:hypothetical protein
MRKNLTMQLAGSGLSGTSTALLDVNSNGQVIGSPDREIETVGFAVPSSQCAICLLPFTDGHGDVCADCWPIYVRFIYPTSVHHWTRCENVPGCQQPALCPLHSQAWIRAYQLTRTAWPVWARAPIGGDPNAPALDFKAHYQYPDILARIVQYALEHPHVASTDPWIKTPEEWEKFGPDRPLSYRHFQDPWASVVRVIHGGNFASLRWPTEQKIKISDPFFKPVEGTFHVGADRYCEWVTWIHHRLIVRCRMPGCKSEYVSNGKASKRVRYVCPKHTHAQLQRARVITKPKSEEWAQDDYDARFDQPEYRFNHTTPKSSPELTGLKDLQARDRQNDPSDAQYAADNNGRYDSDLGHVPTSGVHRPNKSAPGKPAYKPVDPVHVLRLLRSAWDKRVELIQYPLEKVVGIQLVPSVPRDVKFPFVAGLIVHGRSIPFQIGTVWIKCDECGRVTKYLSSAEPYIVPPGPPRCPHGFMLFGEELETSMSLKCMVCRVSPDLRHPFQVPPDRELRLDSKHSLLCPDCDPSVEKIDSNYHYKIQDDLEQRVSALFSARRGDTGEGIEDAIPEETLAQEKRLDEIKTRWQDHVKFVQKRNHIDDDETRREQIIEILKSDQNFQQDVSDFQAIDEGNKLEDRMASKRRRDQMNDRIIRSSEFDALHPDLDWAKLLKPGSKEAKLFRQGGTFIVIKQDRYRLYRLGDYDLPVGGLNGRLSFLGLTEPFQERLNTAMQNARKGARKRGLDENVQAEIARQEFLSAEVFWVRRVRKQRLT